MMFPRNIFLFEILILSWVHFVLGQVVSLKSRPGSFELGTREQPPIIYVDPDETKAVRKAASDLALDFGRVLGQNSTVITASNLSDVSSESKSVIVIGTIGKSRIANALTKHGEVDVGQIEGQWESYVQQPLKRPSKEIGNALVIIGSDPRGSIYGIYDVSENIGVSPWHWWADVAIKPADTVYCGPDQRIQRSPSVKYRGIFINDEEQCLTGWANKRFPISDYDSPFTSGFYELVFELILRLKANYLWPAMKYSMFYVDDPENARLADEYGVVIGTSHHEPMARAYAEQEEFMEGNWDWSLNEENITEFMAEGVDRSKDWQTLYTVGMRGEGDSESPTLTAPQLERIIQVQQDQLSSIRNASLGDIPHVWALYKEVGKYYQAGMDVPDDVTLLWTDDNYGNLLRTPYPNETSRTGGAGVYYHVNYVGRPKQYEWINTVQLIKTWEQMHLAYSKKAKDVWIVNVGDIKPLEIPTSHFLDMAYDISKHESPESVGYWLEDWASKQFGTDAAAPTADILNRYGLLVMRRKYEALNTPPLAFSTKHYDEAESTLTEWEDLYQDSRAVYDSLDEVSQAAFFQMVLHPVEAGKTVYELFLKAEIGKLYAEQRRTSTNQLAHEARAAFRRDAEITDEYHAVSEGKWDNMMCQVHINFPEWYESKSNIMPKLSYVDDDGIPESGIMGIAGQGDGAFENGELTLLLMNPYMPPSEKRWLDVFTRANGSFSYDITPNVSFVSITNSSGTLSAPDGPSDVRSFIAVDWSEVPPGESWVELRVRRSDEDGEAVVYLPLANNEISRRFKGFVESNGVVSMEAAHFMKQKRMRDIYYETLPYYGRTHSGVKIWPDTVSSQTVDTAPKLTYEFWTFTEDHANLTVFLGGSRNHDGTRPLKYAFAIDGGEPTEIEPVGESPMGSDPEGWADSVITGGWNKTAMLEGPLKPGPHALDLWLLEPGVVVQKIAVDFGGLYRSAAGPPESYRAAGL